MKNILLATRMLLRFKVYTLINLLGLILSLTCALIIARYIHQEYTVDHYCPELDRTFLMTVVNQNNAVRLSGASLGFSLSEEGHPLNDPAVEKYSTFIVYENNSIDIDGHSHTLNMIVADSSFLDIMQYPVVKGLGEIKEPTDAVISEQFAKKIFGEDNVIGKTFKTSFGKEVTVKGVIDNKSAKSSFNFDLLVSYNACSMWSRIENQLVRLHNGEDVDAYNTRQSKPEKNESYLRTEIRHQLVSLHDFYFDHTTVKFDNNVLIKGNKESLRILSIVAVILLLIGIANYVNLYLVIMRHRAKEFGVKRVYGISNGQVFGQLLLENTIVSVIVLFFVGLLIEISSGTVAKWFDIRVASDWAFDLPVALLIMISLPLGISIYSFIGNSYATTINSLSSIVKGGQSIRSRVVFLTAQYMLTICLIILSIFFSKQLRYMLNYDLNYNTKDIVEFKFGEDQPNLLVDNTVELKAKLDQVIVRLESSPYISGWSVGYLPIGYSRGIEFLNENDSNRALITIINADLSFLNIFDFKLKEGRLWDKNLDKQKEYKLIVNEAMLKTFGITDYSSVRLRSGMLLWREMTFQNEQSFEIVGVVEDFKAGHLSGSVKPIAFVNVTSDIENSMVVSLAPGKRAEAIAFLENLYHEVNGEGEFTYTFMDDEIAALYKEDARAVKIYVTFAIIAILISCLGLFGLSLYDIRQRYREIALRKINGASVKVITLLLLRKYLYTLLFAAVVASGISYIAIEKYMESYTTRAPLSAWIFIVAILITALISFCTLWWQIRKAIQINPADVLRGE